MIDRAARDQYAEHLRHFAAGLITNDDYEDQTCEILNAGPDDAILEVYKAVWFVYSDVGAHKLVGKHALSRAERRVITRYIAFLYSDVEYQWPRDPWYGWFCNLFTMGGWGRLYEARLTKLGDYELWPFRYRADYQRVLAKPRLLSLGAPSHAT